MIDRKVLIVFRKKSIEMLLFLLRYNVEMPISWIAKEIDSTFHCTYKNVVLLEKLGIIKTFRKGRTRNVRLTELGKKIAIRLDEIINLTRKNC